MVITKHVYEVYLKDFLIFWFFFVKKDEFKNWIKRQGQNVFCRPNLPFYSQKKRCSIFKMKNEKFDFWNEWNEDKFVVIVNQNILGNLGKFHQNISGNCNEWQG